MDTLLPITLVAVSNILWLVISRQASKERQRLVNAVLARTPAEFALLERQAAKPKKVRKAEAEAAAIPPIGL